MRTSGAGNETQMIVAVGLVALGIVVLLAGGPSEFLTTCEQVLRGLAESAQEAWVRASR